MAHQYAPVVEPGGRIVTRRWPDDPVHQSLVEHPRDDLLLERPEAEVCPDAGRPKPAAWRALAFTQEQGPFTAYRRTVERDGDELVESTEYGVTIPWFGWLFRWPVRAVLRRQISAQGWWAPPDRLDPTQLLVLGLLAAASMSAAFVNTLFTQTVSFAADDFGVDNTGVGIAGAFVRVGIVIALPAALIADRIGRRRVIVWVAWLGPLLSVLGALAPTFGVLVVTQTLARPMGIALAFLVGVVAAEEMPRNSRAYAISILAMAAGFGAGVAVIALRAGRRRPERLAPRVRGVPRVVPRRARPRPAPPETRRFTAAHITKTTQRPPINRRRLGLLAAVAFIGNIFIAPASFFQNRYLTDVQGFSGGMIGLFSIAVGDTRRRRADRRRAHRRHERAAAPDRRGAAGVDDRHRRGVHGERRVVVDPLARRWRRRQRRLSGARRVPGGAVPDRQSQPGRGARDGGVADRRGHRPPRRWVPCSTRTGRSARSWPCSGSAS